MVQMALNVVQYTRYFDPFFLHLFLPNEAKKKRERDESLVYVNVVYFYFFEFFFSSSTRFFLMQSSAQYTIPEIHARAHIHMCVR